LSKVKVNDIQIYYEIHGEGPRLLYLSGSGGDLRDKPNIFDSPLKDHFTILAFDQRGLGQTDKPDIEYTMADYCEDTVGLMDVLGWESVNVYGYSFGGMVGQELAIRHSEKVEKMVIASTSSGGKGGASYPFHEMNDLSYEERSRKLIGIIDTRYGDEWKKANLGEYEEMVQNWVKGYKVRENEPGKKVGAYRQLIARKNHDTYDRLDQIKVPILICGGKYDANSPPSNHESLHKKIQGSKLEFFEGGHGFLNQDPKAYEKIIEFYKE